MVVGNRGHGNSRCSLDLNSLDSSRSSNMVGSSWSSNMVGSSRGNSNGGSWGSNCVVSNNRGSYGDNRGSVGNRINKSILVHIFRESLQLERGVATVGSNEVTNKRGEGARS